MKGSSTLESNRSPLQNLNDGAPSICFVCSDEEEANGLRVRLAEHGMVALNIDRTIRVSFHGYNGGVEVSKLIEVLDRELPSR